MLENDLKVGQVWFVKLTGGMQLHKRRIAYISDNVVGISSQIDIHTSPREPEYYQFDDIFSSVTFVELIEDAKEETDKETT